MIIGVNTRFLLKSKMEGFGWFTYETISRIVKNHPEHRFIFFFDRPYDERFVFASNVKPVVLLPPTKHVLIFPYWFNIKLKNALLKHRCDAFIAPDGFLSLTTKLPQLAVMHDLNFEHNPKDLPKLVLRYYKKYFPKFAHKSKRIVTVSNYSKKDIVNSYNINPEKIDVVWNGVSDVFSPLSEEKKALFRKKYTHNKPFVLFVGAIHKRKNLQRLLLAFAELKKQKSIPHQLLIVGEELWSGQHFEVDDAIKEDVQFSGHIDLKELSGLMASATLLAYVSYFEGFGIPLVEAMRCGTPVLAGNKTSLPEVAGDAAFYCDPYSVDSIKKGLSQLLESEKLREEMSAKGIQRAKNFSWDLTADGLWKSFSVMMEK
jgi:glycosyltransferase involved in cell wall biosynthesis